MERITIKAFPETGRYRLYSNQPASCTFFDAADSFSAKTYAIGSIGMMVSDKTGTLTDLETGSAWAIAVEVTPLTDSDMHYTGLRRGVELPASDRFARVVD